MEYIKLPVTRRTCGYITIKDKTWFYPINNGFGESVAIFLECQEIDETDDYQAVPKRYDIYVFAKPEQDTPREIQDFCLELRNKLTDKFSIRRWLYEGYLASEESTKIIFHFKMGGKR